MEQKLLTIAIPTYNRRNYIEESLNSILKQYDNRIELIVMDNCSPDDTQIYMSEMVKQYPFIHYYRNEKNLGPDGNFLKCLRKATGKYVFLLSDDDILAEGSLINLINFLDNSRDYCILELNSNSFFESTKEINEDNYIIKEEEPIVYEKKDFGALVEKLYISLTFLSTMVFNKQLFDKIIDPEKYNKTSLLQTHLLFEIMGMGNYCALLPNVKVHARGGNTGGYNIYKVFIKNWKEVLFDTAIKKGFIPKKSIKKAFDKTLLSFMPSWVIGIRKKEYTTFKTDHKWKYLLYAINSKSAWTHLYPLVILPLPIIDYIRNLRHRT